MDIKDHPAVSSEYVKFLTNHSKASQVENLIRRVEDLEKQMKNEGNNKGNASKGGKKGQPHS